MPELTLSCPSAPSDTGAYRLSWTGLDAHTYRLEENGELLYQGSEQATTVSGRPAGDYEYRVGVATGAGAVEDWSDPCHVVVAPPSLELAFLLFSLGFLAFAAVLVVIVRGHRAHKRGELG